MVEIKSIQQEVINNLENRREIYAKLFKLSLAVMEEKENIVCKEFISKINEHFKASEDKLYPCQIVFISKVMINLILHFNNKKDEEINFLKEVYKEKLSVNIEKDVILKAAKNLEDFEEKNNIDDLILYIIKHFLNELANNCNNSFKQKQDWDKLGLYLENFEINDAMKEILYKFLEENENIAKYFEEIDLITNVKSNSKILKEIYDYIEFKSIKKEKKVKIKYDGDKERANNNYGRDVDITENENSQEKSSNKNSHSDNKLPAHIKDHLPEILDKLIIKVNLGKLRGLETNEINLMYYYIEKNKEPKDIKINCENKYSYSNIKEENFVKYLEFINKVSNYIKEMKKEIQYDTQIYLELTITSKEQNEGTINEMEKRKRPINKKLYNVKCLSYFYEDENDEGNRIEFKDENVLVYGLDGPVPGFVYLINELCNDDYKEEK